MKKVQLSLVEIDLSRGKENFHPDIILDDQLYLAKCAGRFETGYFYKVWYGYNFSGFYDAGLQFDTPGSNGSNWEQLWEIHTVLKK